MAVLNDNFTLNAPVPIDDKLGWWDDATGEWKPFASRQDAIDKTPYYRFRTMTLPVEEDGNVVEYWFKMGVEDDDLVLKTSQADLSNYYTKTELQTPGQSNVHWDNITNVPSFATDWGSITGDQSVVGNAGFTNTAGYITSSDIPSYTLQQILTNGDAATRGAYFNIPEETNWGADTEIKIGDYDLVNDPDGFSVGIRVHNSGVGFNTDIGAVGLRVTSGITDSSYLEPGSVRLSNNYGSVSMSIGSSGRIFGGTGGDAILQNSSGTIAYLSDIPDLTGYATEQWVEDQNYLTSVPWSFNVNNGDLTINGVTNNLDGRWLEKAEGVITEGYGITVNGELATGMGIEVNTTTLDARYLRKDQNDNNDTFSLTLGGLISETATIQSTLTLASLATGSTSDSFLTITSGGIVQKVALPSGGGPFTVANAAGVAQFTVGPGEVLRFADNADAVVTFNASTKTVTYSAVGGGGGTGIQSVFGRPGPNVVAEDNDYTTSLVGEGTRLYFTEPRVRATPLTGYSVGANTNILATDTVLQAFGKTQGQINSRVPTTRTLTVDGTAGNITVSGGTFDLSANRTWTVNLATAGTAGTYTKVVTDAYGRVTTGGALTVSDLPSSVFQQLTYVPPTTTPTATTGGQVTISDGNSINIASLAIGQRQDANTRYNGSVFTPYVTASGNTNYPSTSNAAGWRVERRSGDTSQLGMEMWTSGNTSGEPVVYMRNFALESSYSDWAVIATRTWVSSVLPTDYISTSGNQTGLSGNKTTSGTWSFSGPTSVPVIIERTGTGANSSIQYTTTSGNIYAGQGAARTFGVGPNANLAADAWLNVSADSMTYVSSNTTNVTPPNNGIVFSRNVNGAYVQGGGSSTTSWTLRSYVSNAVQFELNEGGINFNTTGGLLYYQGDLFLNVGANTNLSGPTSGSSVYLRPNGNGSTTGQAIFSPTNITLNALTGSGTQMVTVTSNGVLGRQTIPAVGVTSVATGAHLTGGPITSTGSISLLFDANNYVNDNQSNPRLYFGTSSANDVIMRLSQVSGTWNLRNSANSTIFTIDSSGSVTTGSVPWARLTGEVSVVAGNGLSGGGALSASRTLTLGDPGTITGSTTNSVSTNSHTHAITLVSGDITGALGYTPVPGGRTVTAGNGLTGGGALTANISLAVGAGSGISVAATTVGVDSTVLRTTGNQTKSGVLTLSSELVAHSVRLETAASSGTTINMASVGLLRLSSISSNTTYTLSNSTDGRSVQCTVSNTNSSNSVTVSVTGATLLGSNIIGPSQSAVISIINFGGGLIRYTVVSSI